MTDLTGTPKQIAWAEIIRQQKYTEMQAHHSEQRVMMSSEEFTSKFCTAADGYSKEQLQQIVLDALDRSVATAYEVFGSKASASFWIEVRDLKAYQIINSNC